LRSPWSILGAWRALLVAWGIDIGLILAWLNGGTSGLGSISWSWSGLSVASGVGWFILVGPIWSLLAIVEGSRIPADLPECESELVSG
jgi:NADH:ubiquinone oxidoreductase subunit H